MKHILSIIIMTCFIGIILILCASKMHSIINYKQYEIKRQNNKEILYKSYEQHTHLNKDLKSFYSTYSHKFYKTPQNKILYEGYIVEAHYDREHLTPKHKILIKTITKRKENNNIIQTTQIQNITHCFTNEQIKDLHDNHLNHYIIIKETYFPITQIIFEFYETKP